MTNRRQIADPRRIIFDVSTSMRWAGAPVGIVRVEREFALRAQANVPDVVFAAFNPDHLYYQRIGGSELRPFLLGSASVDTLGLADPTRQRLHRTDRIPPALKPGALWVLQFRRKLLQTLERARLRAKTPALSSTIDGLQRAIMSPRHPSLMLDESGRRRDYIPWGMIFSESIQLRSNDILVCAGSGWAHTNIRAIACLKRRSQFSLVLFCHDIIPLQFPQFYSPRDAKVFSDYFLAAFPLADLVVFSSRRVAEDVRAYCAAQGIALRRLSICPLGADSLVPSGRTIPLPRGLEPGRYALFVSTIEPRKGHRMICSVWRRLLREGIPQATRFKLVFVGRPGWMVEELMQAICDRSYAEDSLQYLAAPDDQTLAALYERAAFCLYPSVYEGYGLPVFEAFSRGKAVLASNGGALGEIAHAFSPQLDPTDEEAWYRAMKAWIVEPERRAPFEDAIRRFKHQSWSDAAAAFFELIQGLPMPEAG